MSFLSQVLSDQNQQNHNSDKYDNSIIKYNRSIGAVYKIINPFKRIRIRVPAKAYPFNIVAKPMNPVFFYCIYYQLNSAGKQGIDNLCRPILYRGTQHH